MRVNDFEKRVQQKMSQFNLSPSPEVWKEVERRIRKEKKRRFIFWWLLLLGGGIAAGILFIPGKKKQPVIAEQRNDQTNKIEENKNKNENTLASTDKNTTAGYPVTTTASTEKIAVTENVNHKNNIPTKQLSNFREEKKIVNRANANDLKKKISSDKQDKKIEQDPRKEIGQPTELTTVPAKIENPTSTKDIQTDAPVTDSKITGKTKESVVSTRVEQEKKDSALINNTNKKKDIKTTKWDWGMTVAGGGSSILNPPQFTERYFSSAALGTTPMAPLVTTVPVSDHKAGNSFSLGIFAQEKLSKKLSLRIGLDYEYLSSRLQVGSRVEGPRAVADGTSSSLIINDYYRAPAPAGYQVYVNRYHFLSLSGELSLKIVDRERFKMNWDNGLSYRQLVASNMLHYGYGLHGYYENNKLMNKSQLFISTGLSFPVAKGLVIQPNISYGLTPVLKNADSLRMNYLQYGIRLRFLLNKK